MSMITGSSSARAVKSVSCRSPREKCDECHCELVEAHGNNALPYPTVVRWVGKFQKGRVSASDEQRGEANAEADGIGASTWLW
ncbi:hypothetical protein TNCV_3131821 [Trichonephila clavipes]|nr:hypothetical protein TNCV_3131821 [Trichonephila clavipes]